MYEDIRQRLYEQYRTACAAIALLSVKDLAQSVKTAFPDAIGVVMSDSDQGDYLWLECAVDAAGQVVADADQLEAAGIESMATAGNLSSNTIGTDTWSPFAPWDDKDRVYRLDIATAMAIPTTDFTP